MFNVKKHTLNRLDIEISGKLDSIQMIEGLNGLLEESTDFQHGKMLYRITDFEFPAFSALAVEIPRIPQLFKLIARFDKVAVVADKIWVRRISEIEGALIPGLSIRAFNVDQQDQAEDWLNA
ncbi:MAG: hypothetical protein ACI8VW_000150 [bacterium]|jgi:hypothetical protein